MKDWPLSAATIEVQGYEGRLHVLPGHKSTGDVRIYLSSSGSHLNALDWLTGAAREAGYEYVIVDTPPAPAIDNETRQVLDALIAPAFFAAHFVLAPVQLEQLAIAGLASLSATLDILRQMGGTARLLGVVPMMYDARTTEHAIHLQDLVSVYNNLVYPVVGKAIDVARCPVYGLPVWEFAPKSKASAQLRAVAERMARDVKDQG
jgi:chromosome partitioning protein